MAAAGAKPMVANAPLVMNVCGKYEIELLPGAVLVPADIRDVNRIARRGLGDFVE